MSDHIPIDLQVEIIKRLPTKSLLKFRAVSKPWKSLIDSAKFIADYKPQSKHLLIRSGYYRKKIEYKYVTLIDDDTFPQHKFSLTVPSSSVNYISNDSIGYSHGLFCLLGRYYCVNTFDFLYMAVIWNPSIRKSVDIDLPNLFSGSFLGFGVCRDSNDPKIVKINEIGIDVCSYEDEVFTLSSGLWRRPLSKLPDKWFHLKWGNYPVVIDMFIYWFASYDEFHIIVSFDLTIEEFKHVYLPDKLAFDHNKSLSYRPIYKLRESLAVVKYEFKADKQVYKVWRMDNGVSKLFTEIYTINLPYASLRRILGFRNNGDLIMEMRNDDDDHDSIILVVCEPGSERMNRLGISGNYYGSLFVSSYKESLLLLNQPNM